MFPFVDKHHGTYTGSAGGSVCRSRPGEIENGDSLLSSSISYTATCIFFVLKKKGKMLDYIKPKPRHMRTRNGPKYHKSEVTLGIHAVILLVHIYCIESSLSREYHCYGIRIFIHFIVKAYPNRLKPISTPLLLRFISAFHPYFVFKVGNFQEVYF
jgi:hypothetical protein